ncbi:lipopolysaccharide biosynthesis protein [Dictyobacter alpinus]|nr:lipopolysaccharide biosynthesis protein [Dictyobacter alpinus]
MTMDSKMGQANKPGEVGRNKVRHGLIKDPTTLFVSTGSNSYNSENMAIDQQLTWLIPAITDLEQLKQMSDYEADPKGYAPIIRTLLKNSGIYAIASCLSPLTSLFLTPFLTRHLTGTDYSILTILNATLVLLGGLSQLGLGPAFVHMYHRPQSGMQDQPSVSLIATFVGLVVLLSFIMTIALNLLSPWIAQLLFHNSTYINLLCVGSLVLLLQNLTIPAYTWLRTQNRARFFTALAIVNLLLNLVLTILLVGIWQWGIQGVLIALCGSYAGVLLCIVPFIKLRSWRQQFRWDIARQLVVTGLSTVPGFLASWVLQLSDRYFLLAFNSFSLEASYAVAYTLGNMLGPLVITPFSLAWHSALYTIAKKANALELFRQIFRFYCLFVLLIVFTVSILAREILDWFFLPGYTEAAAIIPLIALSNVMYGLFEIFSLGIMLRDKLYFNVILLPLAALVNLVCNYVLISNYGVMGAAISTLLAYCLLAVLAYWVNQRIYAIPFECGLCSLGLLIGIFLFSCHQLLFPHVNYSLRLIIGVVLIICYAICLWALNKTPVGK